MKFKVLFVLFFGILMSLIGVNTALAGWPIHKTLPIEGRVIDATTGQPIENVVISVGWVKHGPAEIDTGTSEKVFRHLDIITGKDGKYRIPGTTNWFIFSSFKNMGMGVYHPLYESQRINIHHETKSFSGKYTYGDTDHVLGRDLFIENGVVKYDISIVSLEGRIKSGGFNYGSFLQMYNYDFLNRYYGVEFIKEVFRRWEALAAKYFSNNGQVKYELERLRKELSQ